MKMMMTTAERTDLHAIDLCQALTDVQRYIRQQKSASYEDAQDGRRMLST